MRKPYALLPALLLFFFIKNKNKGDEMYELSIIGITISLIMIMASALSMFSSNPKSKSLIVMAAGFLLMYTGFSFVYFTQDEDVEHSAGVLVKNNLSASVDPKHTDNKKFGYKKDSIWINNEGGVIYKCKSSSDDSAEWVTIGGIMSEKDMGSDKNKNH